MEIQKEIQELNLVMSRINGMSYKWAQEHGLNAYTIKVLYSLGGSDPVTQKQICASSGMPKQTVNNIIRALEKDHLVVLRPHENDKREKVIALTEKGEEYLKSTLIPLMDFESRVIDRMGLENYELLLKCMNSYSEAIENEMEQSL